MFQTITKDNWLLFDKRNNNIQKIKEEQSEINQIGGVKLFSGAESVVDKLLGSKVAGPFKEAANAARTTAAKRKGGGTGKNVPQPKSARKKLSRYIKGYRSRLKIKNKS